MVLGDRNSNVQVNVPEHANMKNVIATSLLSLREKQKVTYKTCSSFLNFTSAIISLNDAQTSDSVKQALTDENVHHETTNRIVHIIQNAERNAVSHRTVQ